MTSNGNAKNGYYGYERSRDAILLNCPNPGTLAQTGSAPGLAEWEGLDNQPQTARHRHGYLSFAPLCQLLARLVLLSFEGSRTCLIGEGLARGVQSKFGYTPINIFLLFRKLRFSWKGGILDTIFLRHGAAEAQPVASDCTRDTGRQAPDARNTSLVCDCPKQKSPRHNNT